MAGTPPTQEGGPRTAAIVVRSYAFPNVSFDSNGGMTLRTFACHTGMGVRKRDSWRS